MGENEKKVTELNEEELGNIAGGFITPDVRYGGDTPVCLVCPDCGKKYFSSLKEYCDCNALCPECGAFGKRIG